MKAKLKLLKRKLNQFLKPLPVRQCPICSWRGRQFMAAGAVGKERLDCLCPRCGSRERHRLAYVVAERLTQLDFSNVVHVAPERSLSKWIKRRSNNYVSIDLYSSHVMMNMDMTNLGFADNSQTLIWSSHVLEHVQDDEKAIAEMYRVLRPGGIAYIQVPIWRIDTFEDPSKVTPEERLEFFYQSDHVRLYGLDIVTRFENQGFTSAIYRAQEFGPETLLSNGLSFASTNEVFVFQK